MSDLTIINCLNSQILLSPTLAQCVFMMPSSTVTNSLEEISYVQIENQYHQLDNKTRQIGTYVSLTTCTSCSVLESIC